jgi:hypothetical protein
VASEVGFSAGPAADRLTLWPMDGSWSIRLGPLTALEVGKAIGAFVH